jgi:hypothetical protein
VLMAEAGSAIDVTASVESVNGERGNIIFKVDDWFRGRATGSIVLTNW